MNFVVTPAARRDILVQYRFYAEERGAALIAERFLNAVQDAIDKVCRTPGIGTPKDFNTTDLSGLRFLAHQRFSSNSRLLHVTGRDTPRSSRAAWKTAH